MTKAIAVARFASISNGEGIGYTIARRRDETRTEPLNRALYKERNCIERLIGRLKQFRRVATRYEKRAVNFLAMVTIAALMLWM